MKMPAAQIMEDPRAFGAPTFEEFRKNPARYVGADPNAPMSRDEIMASIDRGSQNLARYVKRHKYELLGYRTDKLEEIEKIAKDHNIPLRDFTAECIPQGGGTCDILVKFVSPEERYRRKDW